MEHTDKSGQTQPQSKELIIIEDATTKQKEESPPKIFITYERGSPKTSTWRERIKLIDSNTTLQEAETVLQEMMAKLKETEELEEKATKSSQEEEKVEKILEPSPQPSLGSYYTLLEAGKIIPQKFAVPLFFALEEERVTTHTWMKIAKSKGVENIGPLEEQLKEARKELAMVRHVESNQRVKLQEPNELLKQQQQL